MSEILRNRQAQDKKEAVDPNKRVIPLSKKTQLVINSATSNHTSFVNDA